MGEQEFCSKHSGFETQIITLEKASTDHEKRLREIERTVWKASGLTGGIVLVGQLIIQHYVK